MNAEQKRAWLAVVSAIFCLAGYGLLLPSVGAFRAFAVFALFAVNGFSPLIGRREKSDERDATISRKATLAGGMASYLTFVAGLMAIWGVAYLGYGQEQVSVDLLPMLAILGMIVLFSVRSLVILILYGRHLEGTDA